MGVVAAVAYGLGFLFEVAGIWLIVRRVRAVRREHAEVVSGLGRYRQAQGLDSGVMVQARLERMERASLTVGWPLAVLVLGIVFGYVGNFFSLAA